MNNDDISSLQQELLKYKNENQELRRLLAEKTNTLNSTILMKSEQTRQQEIKLKQEIQQYSATKTVYQTIINQHKSFKIQINALQTQLNDYKNTIQQNRIQFAKQTQSFKENENKYKNAIHSLKQNIIENANNYKIQINKLNCTLNQSQNDKNDLISLIANKMSEQRIDGNNTRLCSDESLSTKMTFTELQARFSELMLAFQKEYNAHKITLSQLKQVKCGLDLKNMEIESLRSTSGDLRNNYHDLRIKCNKYENIYGALNDETSHTLRNTLKQLNSCKEKLVIFENDKNTEIRQQVSSQISSILSQNKTLQTNVMHLQSNCTDKDKSIQRYKNINQHLSNALNTINNNENTNENGKKSNENGGKTERENENELELCQRMYNDQILELQQEIDECNTERSVNSAENIKLKQELSNLYQQHQTLSESKIYLNEIIKKQKLKCNKLNNNISEQQLIITRFQSKYSELSDKHLTLNTKYSEIEIKHQLLAQNERNNNKENLNYRIQNVEYKKLISSIKNESKAYKQQYSQINNKYKKMDGLNKTLEIKLKALQKEDFDRNSILKENNGLKNSVFNLKQQLSKYECDLNNVAKQLQVSHKNESLIPELKSEIEQLHEQIDELNSNQTEMEVVDDDNVSIASIKSTQSNGTPTNKSELKQRLKELRQTSVKTQLENERLTHQIAEYQSFHDNKTRQLTQSVNEYKNKVTKLQTTTAKQVQLISEWTAKYQRAQTRYQRELKNHALLLQDVKQLKQEISCNSASNSPQISKSHSNKETRQDLHFAVLEAEVIANKATAERLKKENEIISLELLAIKQELEEQKEICNPRNISVSIVSVEIFNELQRKYNKMDNDYQSICVKVTKLETENKQYDTQCNGLKNENKILNDNIQRMRKENGDLKQRNLSYLSTYPSIDPQDFEDAQQRVTALTHELKQQSQQYTKRNNELTLLMAKTFAANEKETKATKRKHLVEIAALNGKLKAKTEEFNIKSNLIVKMKELFTKRTGILNTRQELIDKLQNEIKHKMNEINSLKVTVQKAMATEKTLKSEIIRKNKQLNVTENEFKQNVASLQAEKKVLGQEIEKEKKSSAEISALMAITFSSYDTEIDKLKSECAKSKDFGDKMKQVLGSKQQQIDKLNDKINNLCEENKELTEMRKKLQNKIEIYTVRDKEINSLNADLKTIKQKYDKLSTESRKYLNLSIQLKTNQNKMEKTIQDNNKCLNQLRLKLQAEQKEVANKQKELKQKAHKQETHLKGKNEENSKLKSKLKLIENELNVLRLSRVAKQKESEQKEKIQDSQLKGKIVENNALKSKLESIQNELNTTRLLSAAKQNKTQQKSDQRETKLKQNNEEINNLKSELQCKQKAMNKLQQKAKKQETNLKGKTEESNALKSKLKLIQNELNALRLSAATKQKESQQKCGKQETKYNALKSNMESKQKEINKLQQLIATKQNESEKAKRQEIKLKGKTLENNALASKLKLIQNEVDTLLLSNTTKQKKSQQQNNEEINKLKSKLQSKKTELEQKVKEQETKFNEKLESTQKEVNELRELMNIKQNKSDVLGNALNEKNEECNGLKLALQLSEQERNKLLDQLKRKNEQCNKLQQQINTAQQKLKERNAENSEFKLSLKTLRESSATKQKQSQLLQQKSEQQQAKLTLSNEEINKLKSKLESTQKEVNELRELINMKQNKSSVLDNALEAKNEECNGLKLLLELSGKTRNKLLDQYDKSQTKLQENQQQINALQQDSDQKQAKLTQNNEEINKLKSKLESTQNEINTLQELIATKQSEFETKLKQLNERNEGKSNKLSDDLKHVNEQYNKLKNVLEKVKATYEKLKQENTNLSKTIKQKDEGIKSVMSIINKYKTEMTQLQEINNKQSKEINNKNAIIDQNSSQLKALQSKKENEIQIKDKNIKTLQERNDKLENIQKETSERMTEINLNTKAMLHSLEKMETKNKRFVDTESKYKSDIKILEKKLSAETIKYKNIHELAENYQNKNKQESDMTKSLEIKIRGMHKENKKLTDTISDLNKCRTDKQIRLKYSELLKELSTLKKMLMKEKKIRNGLEKTKDFQNDIIARQDKRIEKFESRSRSSTKTPHRRSFSSRIKSPKSSLSTLPVTKAKKVSKVSGGKRKLDAITLDSDSNDDVPPKKRHKVIDLTAMNSKKRSIQKKASSLDSLSYLARESSVDAEDRKHKKKSETILNDLLAKKLENLGKKKKSWCNLSVDFSESKSADDAESIDSLSFPVFDIYFVPIIKQQINEIMDWKKPFDGVLRVNERLRYCEFRKQTNINEWIKKDRNGIPGNLCVFKCQLQSTPNKTKLNNFIQVNKLLSDKKCVGFAQYRCQYKIYFIPASSQISILLNTKYQTGIEISDDRMWVIWLKY